MPAPVRLPALSSNHLVDVRASIGYAVETELPEPLAQLLARADSAMYLRKGVQGAVPGSSAAAQRSARAPLAATVPASAAPAMKLGELDTSAPA